MSHQQVEWTTQDWQRFLEYGTFVHGWGDQEDANHELERRRIGQELGIPFSQDDWTTEDRQRFSEYERQHNTYVQGWSDWDWKCELEQRRFSQELGIPQKQEEWTLANWQLYSKHDKQIDGWGKLSSARKEAERRQLSQELGIPSSLEDWTQKDQEVFANYEREHTRYVSKWSSSEWKWEVKRREISEELGIPWKQEDWTTDHWQRFPQLNRYVTGWGYSTNAKAEVERRQLCQELGIPFEQEKWTTQDKQKFDEYEQQEYRYVEGWSSGRHEEPPEISNEEAEDQQTKDDINNPANDRGYDEHEPKLEAEVEPAPASSSPKVDPHFEEPQPAILDNTVSPQEIESNDDNSKTPTAPKTKPPISVPHPQVSAAEIHRQGISSYQAFALLLIALVLYELIRQNLRL